MPTYQQKYLKIGNKYFPQYLGAFNSLKFMWSECEAGLWKQLRICLEFPGIIADDFNTSHCIQMRKVHNSVWVTYVKTASASLVRSYGLQSLLLLLFTRVYFCFKNDGKCLSKLVFLCKVFYFISYLYAVFRHGMYGLCADDFFSKNLSIFERKKQASTVWYYHITGNLRRYNPVFFCR